MFLKVGKKIYGNKDNYYSEDIPGFILGLMQAVGKVGIEDLIDTLKSNGLESSILEYVPTDEMKWVVEGWKRIHLSSVYKIVSDDDSNGKKIVLCDGWRADYKCCYDSYDEAKKIAIGIAIEMLKDKKLENPEYYESNIEHILEYYPSLKDTIRTLSS